MSRRSPYPQELRERAVRMVAEIRPNYQTEWAAIGAVAARLGVGSAETVRKRVRQAQVDTGQRPGIFSRGAKRICGAFSCFTCSAAWLVAAVARQVWWNSVPGSSPAACSGVELGHELAVGCPCCREVVVAFFELEAEVGGLLLEAGDLLGERVDVGGGAEPGFPPCLLAESFRQPLLKLVDAGGEAGGSFVGGEQVCLQRCPGDGRARPELAQFSAQVR